MVIQKPVISLLVMVTVLVGCGEDEPEKVKPKEVVDEESKKRIIWKKDGAEMRLIPAGSFEMGAPFKGGDADELPVHTVELDAFYMNANEVTVGEFKRFVNQSGYKYGGNWDSVAKYSLSDKHPMIYVAWYDAMAYAKWVGKRLPTEAEWEYAARGGLISKRYPWGDDENTARDNANYSGTGGKDTWSQAAPVGSFEANGYGLYDMAGNVWEWCLDEYDAGYYSKSPTSNPLAGDDSIEALINRYQGVSSYRVLRGGGWANGTGLCVADRVNDRPNARNVLCGFRCVSGLD